jgi:hypothetical protein
MSEKFPAPEGTDNLHEEVLTMKEKPKKDMETRLSPEVLEGIMGKVQDVYEYGTAYSCILDVPQYQARRTNDEEASKYFEDECKKYFALDGPMAKVFKHGILGFPRHDISDDELKEYRNNIAGKWAESIKRGDQNSVSFNIMGRTDKYWNNSFSQWYRGLAVIFDLSTFKEEEPLILDRGHKGNLNKHDQKVKLNTYRIASPSSLIGQTPNEHGDTWVDTEYGFSLYSRVRPRIFKGLAINNHKFLRERLINLMIEIYKDKPKFLVPIYNGYGKSGDLLWPKQMSYEEVKKFVAEREMKDK